MWGDAFLVAPNTSDGNNRVELWLPDGCWYDFWTAQRYDGGRVIRCDAQTGTLPLFVKGGSVVPMAAAAQSTAWIKKELLDLHVYAGSDGNFVLYDDDGETEAFLNGEKALTEISYRENPNKEIVIRKTEGHYSGAPARRCYRIFVYGLEREGEIEINGNSVRKKSSFAECRSSGSGFVWSDRPMKLSMVTDFHPVNQDVRVRIVDRPPK